MFADWNVEQPPVPDFPKAAGAAAGLYLAQKKDAQLAYFTVGQLGGVLRDKDYAALRIMAEILGGGPRSRLRQRLGDSIATLTASWAAGDDHPGLFRIDASLNPFHVVGVLKAVQDELARIRDAEVSEDELKTAKDAALNSLAFEFDNPEKAMKDRLEREYFGYPADFTVQLQQALQGVTRADVLRAAKEHLDPARTAILVVGNPVAFESPLNVLGNPIPIDLAVAPPKPEAAAGDEAAGQRARALLARAQQAVGGADKLAAVKDSAEEASYQLESVAGGTLVARTDRWIGPGYLRQDSSSPVGKISVYTDGSSGWIATPQGTGPLDAAQLKRQLQGDLFRLGFGMR